MVTGIVCLVEARAAFWVVDHPRDHVHAAVPLAPA